MNCPPLLAPIFGAAGVMFGGIVRLRNRLYDASILPQRRLPAPVVSVGNLTVGGSGKTPLVIHLAQTVARLAANPVLLSRGYGRTIKADTILEPFKEIASPERYLGDEPALVRRRLPQLWLGISRNRHALGLAICSRCSHPVFIVDDGFQHRRLHRDLDILVVDRSQPLQANRLLPLGTLREPLQGVRRADIVIINGEIAESPQDPLERWLRANIKEGAEIFHCAQEIEGLVPFGAWSKGIGEPVPIKQTGPVFLVAAIGNPHRFQRDVLALGLDIKGTKFYRDHFDPNPGCWQACIEQARAAGASCIITTEKDAVKLDRALEYPLLVAVQSTRLREQADLQERLQTMIASRL
jgi:tetraacyldisaccharide 4'-kinase